MNSVILRVAIHQKRTRTPSSMRNIFKKCVHYVRNGIRNTTTYCWQIGDDYMNKRSRDVDDFMGN
eukprot:4120860-Pleurochrysis_carterae.AAC.1